jgi:hypothetical protein
VRLELVVKLLSIAALASACSFDQSGVPPQGGDDGVDAGDAGDAGDRPDAGDGDRPDATSTTDRDGDGVLDGVDNCKDVANADQRDHELDGRGDACDTCPHLIDPIVADADGDGVGDACDPRPGSQDRLLHFDGFYDDAAQPPAGWSAVGTAGAWRTRGGRLEQTATTRGAQILYWNKALGAQTVETQARIGSLAEPAPANSNNRTIGAIVGFLPRSGGIAEQTWLCAVTGDVTDDNREMVLSLVQLLGTAVVSVIGTDSLESSMAAGTEVTLVAGLDDVDGGALESCYLRDAGAPGRLTDDDDVTATGYPGVRTNGVAGSFDYVVIFGVEL